MASSNAAVIPTYSKDGTKKQFSKKRYFPFNGLRLKKKNSKIVKMAA